MNAAVLFDSMRVDLGSSTGDSPCPPGASVRLHVFGSPVPGWRMANPLQISVDCDTDGSFIASDSIFDVYGQGASIDAAVRDYKVALVEFFEITSEAADQQSRQLLDHLKVYLVRS